MERSAAATPTREVSCGHSGSCRSRCWSRWESRRPPRRDRRRSRLRRGPRPGQDRRARGLDSPRHLAFGDRGDLFVAEAGRGGGATTPASSAPRARRCMGATGRGDEDRPPRPPVPDRRPGSPRWRTSPRAPAAATRSARTASSSPGDDKRPDHQRRPDRARRRSPRRRRDPDARDARRRQNRGRPSLFGKVLHDHARGRPVPLADIWDYERDFNPDAADGQPGGRLQRRRPARGRQPARRRRRRRQRARHGRPVRPRQEPHGVPERPGRAARRSRRAADPAAGRADVGRRRAPTASTTSASSPASRSRSAARTSIRVNPRTGADDRVRRAASRTSWTWPSGATARSTRSRSTTTACSTPANEGALFAIDARGNQRRDRAAGGHAAVPGRARDRRRRDSTSRSTPRSPGGGKVLRICASAALNPGTNPRCAASCRA